MTSCSSLFYTYTQVLVGNEHEQAIGKNKNQILRLYGVPDRKDSDGADGEIFIYEETSINTTTNAGGMNYGLGQISSSHLSSSTSTTIDKDFVNLYFNKNGIVYDYKSNYGEIYRTEKKFDKRNFIGSVSIGVALLAVIVGLILDHSN